MTSEKKAEANRRNGRKSSGPTSAEGKQRSGRNALKDGIFSKELVVTAAGERVEDYTKLRNRVWNWVQPDNFGDEILANDIVYNLWGRERVRRCLAAEIQNRLQNLKAHDWYLRSDEIEPLRLRFGLALARYRDARNGRPPAPLNEIVTELDHARSELASKPLGLEFLIKEVNAIKESAESKGQISSDSEATLLACAGLTNDVAGTCLQLNWINIAESAKAAEHARAKERGIGHTSEVEQEKAKHVQSQGQKEAGAWNEEACRFALVSAIGDVARQLRIRKQIVESIKKWSDKTRLAAAVLPSDGTCDRFARAETAYDRRLYRALALITLKQPKDTPSNETVEDRP